MKKISRFVNKLMSLLLIISLIGTMFIGKNIVLATETKEKSYTGSGFEVLFAVKESWNGGYKAEVIIKNTGEDAIENWSLKFSLQENISNIWNGTIENHKEDTYLVKNVGWNQDIKPNQEVSFGFIADSTFSSYPNDFCMTSQQTMAKEDRYSVHYTVSESWDEGLVGSIEIKNESSQTIEDWSMEFEFDASIDDIWNALIAKQEGNTYYIKCAEFNQNIQPGASVMFGFSCSDVKDGKAPSNVSLTEYAIGGTGNTDTKEEEGNQEDEDLDDEKEVTQGDEESGSTEDEEIEDNENPEETKEDEELESLPEITEENIDEYVYIDYEAGNTCDSVIDNIHFINESPEILEVDWESSDSSVVSESGEVSRKDKTTDVTITANVTYLGKTIKKEFALKVIKRCQINPNDIEDLNVGQLEKMNESDPYYDIKIDDFGYVERISGRFSDIKVDSYETALMSLYSIKSAMGITNPLEELRPFDVEIDETGYLFKFTQVHQGIKTFSNVVTITADTEGNTDYFSSSYFPIQKEVDTTPSLTYEQAVKKLQERFGAINVQEPEERYCIINYYGHTDFVWEVPCDILQGDEEVEAGSYLILVGGEDGEIKYKNNMQSDADTNVKVSQEDMLEKERTFWVTKGKNGKADSYSLKDSKRKIGIYDTQNTIPSRGSEDGWSVAQVSAMANMKDVYDFYKKEFERYSYNNAKKQKKGKEIKIVLDENYYNSAWDNKDKKIIIGNGSENEAEEGYTLIAQSMAASSDLICHEFTHAIVQHETELEKIKVGIVASINEFYADMGACFFDGNWTIAEDSVVDSRIPMRDNANPHLVECAEKVGDKFYIEPAKFLSGEKNKDLIKDYGGVHFNCTILTHAVYRMEQLGIPRKKLKKIWYKTLRMGYTMRANFYTVRQQFVKATAKVCRNGEYISKVHQAFDEANVKEENTDLDYCQYYFQTEQDIFCAGYFSEYVTVSGKVTDLQKEQSGVTDCPLEDVEVSISQMEGNQQLNTSCSEEDGRYEISADIYDSYRLKFQKEGYLPEEIYLADVDGVVQTEYYCDTVKMIPEENAGKGHASGYILSALTAEGVSGIELKLRKGMNNIYTDELCTIKTNAQGRYVFTNLEAGNYCIEMVCEEDSEYISSYFNIVILGNEAITEQNGIISPKLFENQLRVVLTWAESPEDLDSHLKINLSNGEKGHVCYWNKSFENGEKEICVLDVDDTDSYGPETITLCSDDTGDYQYYVHNYSLDGELESSDAMIQVYMPGEAFPKYTFHVPYGDGEYWDVFDYNTSTGRLHPVNKLTDDNNYLE